MASLAKVKIWMVAACCALATAAAQTVGGISALLPNPNSPFPSLNSAILSNPNVDGVSVGVDWRDFYTQPIDPNSAINWAPLDAIFSQASAAGKFVRLIVAPGFYSPGWVLNSVPVLMLPVPQGALSGTIQPLPVPWDNTYLDAWLRFVDQLAARYGDKPNFAWISVTGPNSHNGEVNLPHGDPVSRQTWLQAAADAGISGQTAQLDWLQQKLESAWFRSIDRFESAFGSRGRHYTIALIDASFPVEGDSTREQNYKNDLVVYGAMHYPHAFGVQTNGLDGEPLCTNVAAPHPWWDFIRGYSGTLLTGFQTQAPGNLYCASVANSTVLHQAIDNAVQYQAHFLEIYSSDIMDPALASDIGYAHQKLGLKGVPTLTAGSAANGATYVEGGLVPGSWAQVKGTQLSNVTRLWGDSDFTGLGNNLPTNLSGVQVRVNNLPAAVYYIDAGQVNFQVPTGISGTASVQVINNGTASNTITAAAVSIAPGIFPIIVNGKNYPAGVFLDGKFAGDPTNGPAFRNAKPGDVIQLYATGLVPTPAGVLPAPQGVSGVTVTIGDVTVPADFAGLVAVGEFQINFTVPQQFASLPPGTYPISISINGVPSPADINSSPPGPVVIPIQH